MLRSSIFNAVSLFSSHKNTNSTQRQRQNEYMMASSTDYPNRQRRIALGVVLIFSFALLLLRPAGLPFSKWGGGDLQQTRRMGLGSRPPQCVNKCLSCKPCMATLVVSPHQTRPTKFTTSRHEEDDGYYLLSWRCACGNKLFQP